jgi:hypothetical protein
MTAPASITITPVLVVDLLAEGERSAGLPRTEGQARVRARTELVWLGHEHLPWRPSTALPPVTATSRVGEDTANVLRSACRGPTRR